MTPVPSPAPSPLPLRRHHHHHLHRQWDPSPTSTLTTASTHLPLPPPPQPAAANSNNNKQLPSVDFSPPLIAMVAVVATAFLLITYSRLISRSLLRILRRWRRWRRRRRLRHYLSSPSHSLDSPPPPFDSPEGFHVYSPYGLDDSVIKTIPLSLYTTKTNSFHKQNDTIRITTRDCAVCLLEFEDNDYVRTLPVCSHSFHVDCIDIWLRSHANCPLCRAGIFRQESPFIPVMAARIRPSLDDDTILNSITLEQPMLLSPPRVYAAESCASTTTEITPCIEEPTPRRHSSNFGGNISYGNISEDRFNSIGPRDILLKRSYSFGFERSLAASERMLVTEPATASPWRYRRGVGGGGGGGSSFWSRRPSPFGSLSKARVFSFRYYKGMKSPFFRRRGGFFPLSERFSAVGGGGGGSSSRRSRSLASPMFLRSSVIGSSAMAFSSSRLRCGDPEALLSPERFNRRFQLEPKSGSVLSKVKGTMFPGMFMQKPDKQEAIKKLKTHVAMFSAWVFAVRLTPYILHYFSDEKDELNLF
ncbi:hypothetical protein Tsubulata_008953 [Turnera subulata]|uniref:RING-type E3 ubiquitin transferase n=1 Tax=Turnera subulata TaxID=218843 RepID=A0A9Q0JC26_9ROSI|nr:hypothetical protein Tsubulata_008953 [Turnera subulata]